MPKFDARLIAAIAFSVSLAACDAIPKDPNRTTEIVQQRGEMRVGFVDGVSPELRPAMERAAALISERHGVAMERSSGAESSLMDELETGHIDLVIGAFPKSSPWSKSVALTRFYPTKPRKNELGVRAAAHKGENRWVLEAERALAEGSQ